MCGEMAQISMRELSSQGTDMLNPQNSVAMEVHSDAEVSAQERLQDEQFGRNAAWLQSHAEEVYSQHRGKVICIAGEELFVGETVDEAVAAARAAHPEDAGWFTYYIPRQRGARVYANQW